MNSIATEQGGGERGQPRDSEQAQQGRYLDRNSNQQLSTFARAYGKLSVRLAPVISITNMYVSVKGGSVVVPR
ncbi:MAG: hypothetical protein GY696_14205 [Gammaproteobacteria bacterium]|nr:hypothetical protein [Gammaproteobacteria bacterium]